MDLQLRQAQLCEVLTTVCVVFECRHVHNLVVGVGLLDLIGTNVSPRKAVVSERKR